jgi:hypothetical protein
MKFSTERTDIPSAAADSFFESNNFSTGIRVSPAFLMLVFASTRAVSP